MGNKQVARQESSVKRLYQDADVAEGYLEHRFTTAWARLLHQRQVEILNDAIRQNGVSVALELAPGPARLATEVVGIKQGLMIESSTEMIELARQRLADKHLEHVWEFRQGNAFELGGLGQEFPLIYTFRFIRHFETEDRFRLYREARGRLEDGGLLVFDVVNRPIREKLDKDKSEKESQELAVYDATYTEKAFRDEMASAGFSVAALYPVIKQQPLQFRISYSRVGSTALAGAAVRLLEKLPCVNPLEWVAVCLKED